MTSVVRESSRQVSLDEVRTATSEALCRAFDRIPLEVTPEWLGRPAGVPA